MHSPTPTAIRLVNTVAPHLRGDALILGGCSAGIAAKVAAQANQVIQVCFDRVTAREVEVALDNLGAQNIIVETHLPDQLPYVHNRFGTVLCLDGSHLVEQVTPWLQQLGRILKADGLLLLRSHLVPGSRLRGKKARLQREAGDYINAFCRLRSAGHRRYLSRDQWEDFLDTAGFYVQQVETAEAAFDFSAWTAKCSPRREDLLRLRAMLIQAPEKAYEFLTPRFSGDRIVFRLPEITILAISKANLDKHGQSEESANVTRQAD